MKLLHCKSCVYPYLKSVHKKKEVIDFLTWLTSPGVFAYLQSQGKTINIEEFKKIGQEYGFNVDTLFIDGPPPMEAEGANKLPVQ